MDRIEGILGAVNDKVQRLLNLDCFYVVLLDTVTGELTFPLAAEKDDKGKIAVVSWPCRAFQLPQLLNTIIEQKQPIYFVVREVKDFPVDHAQDLISVDLALKWLAVPVLVDNQVLAQDLTGVDSPLAWLAVPMLIEDRVLGVMVAENRHNPEAFGQTGGTLLSTVARQTAIAIENARKGERLDRKMLALRAVNEIGRVLSSRIDLDETGIIMLVDQQVTGLMYTSNMYIALYDEETDEVSFPFMRVNGEPREVPSRRGGQGRTEWIIRNRQPELITTRAESEAWYKQPGRTDYISQPFSSWIGVPMFARGRVIGVIAAYAEDQEYAYDEDDLEVLQAIAGRAETAFENSKLYEELRRVNENLEQIVQQRTEELRRVNENLEQIVRERTEELRATNEQLTEANDELRRAQDLRLMAVLGQVTAGLIHKMSNALGPIPNYWVTTVEEHVLPNDEIARKALSRIRDNTSDALTYVEGMNTLLASQKISRQETRLEILLRDALRHVLADAEGCAIDVDNNLDIIETPVIYVSPSLIGEVFQNITRNAIQAMPDGGSLTVRLEKIDDKTLQITVKDTGVGIPEDKQKNIFTPGFSTKKDGMGLGLWFSKAVVEQHHGDINFESYEGIGTTFRIVLPIETSYAGIGVS